MPLSREPVIEPQIIPTRKSSRGVLVEPLSVPERLVVPSRGR
jgi:hypothetical protein